MKHVVMFYGPPHVGKTSYYIRHLAKVCKHIVPSELFNSHPGWGLRQLILNEIIPILEKGDDILIDDTNTKLETRNTYCNIIADKVPGCTVELLEFRPQHSRQQLLWMREFQAAEYTLLKNVKIEEDVPDPYDWQRNDVMIDKWYKQVSPVTDTQLFSKYSKKRNVISAFTDFKFELSALFIEWQAAFDLRHNNWNVKIGITNVLEHWSTCNPCGRIILIIDAVSGISKENGAAVEMGLHQITSKFRTAPIFCIQMTSVTQSGCYSTPPQPGIIAFIQRIHHVNLQHQNTLYLYVSDAHMKMARAAGVRHINIARLLKKPRNIITSYGSVAESAPDFLTSISYDPMSLHPLHNRNSTPEAMLPYYDLYKNECTARLNLLYGRYMYIAVYDSETLTRYNMLYSDNACGITSHVEKICNLKSSGIVDRPAGAKSSSHNNAPDRKNKRALPDWLRSLSNKTTPVRTHPPLLKQTTNSSEETLDNEEEDSNEEEEDYKRRKLKRSVRSICYVMNEEELVQTAKEFADGD